MNHFTSLFGTLTAAFLLPDLLIAQQVYVSSDVTKVVAQNVINPDDNMIAAGATSTTAIYKNEKLQNRFSALFPKAENASWSQKDQTLYVSFSNEGKKIHASFTINGELNYAITDCSREQLPESLQKYLQKNYGEYDLHHAKQINAFEAVSYEVILENADNFITIRSTKDGIEKIRQVNKVTKK